MNKERDMFYGGYNNGMPMMGIPNQGMFQNEMAPMNDINNKLNRIDNQIKRLDQRLSRLENPYGNSNNSNYNNDPDNSMYMM